jgi:hypothetical protein
MRRGGALLEHDFPGFERNLKPVAVHQLKFRFGKLFKND